MTFKRPDNGSDFYVYCEQSFLETILMANDAAEEQKRKLTGAELGNFLRIKKRLEELQVEDGKLREELTAMGLKFERKWWHGPLGKPQNFTVD
jgi:hypothetical protein